jgi:hypothetical protein
MEGSIMTDIRMSSIMGTPYGTSAQRDTLIPSPAVGQTFYNGTLGVQEIYTSSGWLPATGANDFNVTLNGSATTATFTKEYFAGAYTIASALLDSTYDIYVYDTAGNQVGYTKSPSLNATGNFNKIVIIGGTQGDLLSFSYKTTFTATNTTSQTTAGAFITSATPTALNSIDDTTTIIGGNFASNVSVYFVGSDNTERAAKSIVRTSSSELIVTRPDTFPTDLGTYKLIVENPGVTRPTGSSLHILNNAITAGSTPNWTTGTTLPEVAKNIAYSTTLLATDTEGTDIDYSVVSGSLPAGITLNNETGVLSGTYTGADFNTTNLVIRAVDTGGNIVDRTFTIFSSNPVWTTTSITGYTTSSAYSFQLVATDNSSISYSVVSGTLQTGLSLSSSGLISGTTSSTSTNSITFRATDSVGNYSDRSLTLGPAIVTSGLRVWYASSSYNSGSNTITDLSGNGFNATKRSGITVGGSTGTQFLQFPSNAGGNHSQLIHVPGNSILGLTSWSLEAWVNQSTSDNLQTLFHGGGAGDNYHLIGWNNDPTPSVWMGNVGGASINTATAVPTANTDNHVVWSLNGSNNTINFYVNGTLSGTTSVSSGTITAQNTTNQNVYVIGQELDTNNVDISSYIQSDTKQEFTGKLYSFRLYNKALSGSEVLQNYGVGKHV